MRLLSEQKRFKSCCFKNFLFHFKNQPAKKFWKNNHMTNGHYMDD